MQVYLASGVAAVALTGAGFAGDTVPGSDELLERLRAAESRIAELESQNSDNWLTEQRAEEIRGLVQDVLADADTRASLLQTGMTAGYDNGAVISSADGNWLLRTNILMQQRFAYSHLDAGTAGAPPDENVWGFSNTRTKFILSGHVVNPQFFYRADINVGNAEGSARTGLLNAYLGYDYGNGLKFYLGQFKTPLLREELIESQYQQAVERSVFNYQFGGGYTDGIMAEYATDQFRAWGSYNDGIFTGGTGALTTGDTEFAVTGRGEFKISGTWDQFDDLTSPPGSEQGILIGGAIHWQTGERGDPAYAPQADILLATLDAQVEMSGWNVYGAFVYSNFDVNVPGTETPDIYGIMVQGGFYVAEDWEPFARWEWADYDTPGASDLGLITIGINKYFAGHNAKWTTDFGFGYEPLDLSNFVAAPALTGGAAPNPLTNWRADNIDEDGQWLIRSQFQIYF
jgi:hypothetical protein